jgi:hypothetical protein
LYIIGVTNFHVEVDTKFIQGLLNNPDLQPDAAVNRWIQRILMFHFELIHVPAVRFQGPDALSRRGRAKGETAEDDDDEWLDRIALVRQVSPKVFQLEEIVKESISAYGRLRLEVIAKEERTLAITRVGVLGVK